MPLAQCLAGSVVLRRLCVAGRYVLPVLARFVRSKSERILPMVFLPSGISSPDDGPDVRSELFSRGARTLIEILEVVGTVRDGDHLQSIVFIAQEFGLLAKPIYLFGIVDDEPRRVQSLLLEGHYRTLLQAGLVDVDATGRLRPRHDLIPFPPSNLVSRRLAALNALSPAETVVFAAAVLRLATGGLYAGSPRRQEAFEAEVRAVVDTLKESGDTIDGAAIGAVRRRLVASLPATVAFVPA
ncbi:MAG TPA: hypothetical protein VFE42_27165 [Chloroflexota bacterium]|nr:hypothetical protein [Chloroflexota bacterium]